jgi:hypothetical protein
MKEDLIIFGLIALFIVYTLSTKKEGFFDMSGYNKPLPGINQKSDKALSEYKPIGEKGITNDDVAVAVSATQKYISEKIGKCVHVIETNKIDKLIGPRDSILYRCRFMMMVKDGGFPYAFGVDSEVLDGKVITALTQSFDSSNQGVAEEKPGNFEDIEKYYDSKIKDVF